MNAVENWAFLFDQWKERIEALIHEHPLQIISWEATRRCNLCCAHCGSPSEEVDPAQELTTNEIVSAFDQIAHDFDMGQFHHINITGGEPFVRSDLLDVLRAISKWSFYRNIDIQTNGLFVADHPNILQNLGPLGVSGLGISIDGFKPSHDALRRRDGAWDKAVCAARLAVEAGYVVTVSCVAHAKNIGDLEAFCQFVRRQIRPRVFRVMFIDPLGRAANDGEYRLSPSQTWQVIDFLKREYEATCLQYADPGSTMVELGCGGWLGTELEGRVRPFIFHCIAGVNNLGILYDGKLGSCSNISREFIEGDLRKDRIRDVWEDQYQRYRDFQWKRTGFCVDCDQWEYCHGGGMHRYSCSVDKPACLFSTLYHTPECEHGK